MTDHDPLVTAAPGDPQRFIEGTERLCDDNGLVSDEPVNPPNPFDPTLTYRGVLNNLRRAGGHPPYTGDWLPCTGSVHLAGLHLVCTSPAHAATGGDGE